MRSLQNVKVPLKLLKRVQSHTILIEAYLDVLKVFLGSQQDFHGINVIPS